MALLSLGTKMSASKLIHYFFSHPTAFGWVVALHLGNSTAKAYLCNQGGTASPFLPRLACWILSLTNKHRSTLIWACIPTQLNVETNYLSWGQLLPEWHILPQITHVAFCLWDLPEVDLLASTQTPQCKHQLHLGHGQLPSGGLGCWMPSIILGSFRCKLCVSLLLHLVPLVLSKFLAEHVKGQLRFWFLVAPMLDGSSLASHILSTC